jgi:orotidine-5'-phosphate decarboxylase
VVSPPIIVALDVPDAEQAVALAELVAPHVGAFKVGLGLLHGGGPGVIEELAVLGPVMVDAKLHDIPTQVEVAAQRLGEHGARWITAHASGGAAMLEAAAAGLGAGACGAEAGVLAVTLLTSIGEAAAASVFGCTPGEITARLAAQAAAAEVEGVVCSPLDLGIVAEVAPGLLRVTPGIRPSGAPADDQQRTAGAREALERGADLLVVGRAILGADDPREAAERLRAALCDG